jgi:7-cyano-7-deazaguanine reductase
VSTNDFRTDGSIDAFPNSYPHRETLIRFDAHEFTSLCPMTGQPDFGVVTLEYVPGERCIELRSWKFYLQTFRQRGIFYENLVNTILDDVVAAISPRHATVTGEFSRRGGISARVSSSYSADCGPGLGA